MRTRRYSLLFLVPLFTASFSGCFGPDLDSGSFNITYSGDASGAVSGPLLFDGSNINWFMFGPEADPGEKIFTLGWLTGERPEAGTYDVWDHTSSESQLEDVFSLVVRDTANNLSTRGIEGTVTITESSSNRVSGRFDATLTDVFKDITISATGTFEATSCDEVAEPFFCGVSDF